MIFAISLAEQFSREPPPPPPKSAGLPGITRQRVGLPLKIFRLNSLLLLLQTERFLSGKRSVQQKTIAKRSVQSKKKSAKALGPVQLFFP